VDRPDEPRSRLAVGIEWASRVTTVGLEFALPPLLGAWFDRWRGTSPLGVLLGAALGFGLGMAHLLRFARDGAAGGPKAARRG
jgi:F0F1-type ATP synthase assembly protein I